MLKARKRTAFVDLTVICNYQLAFASPFGFGPSFMFGSCLSSE